MEEKCIWRCGRLCSFIWVGVASLLAGCAASSSDQSSREDLLKRGDRLAHAQYLEANNSMIELHRRGVVYEDEASRELINGVLKRLFPGKENNPVRVTLARLPGENAYALPSGDIIIHQSMLAALSSEAQLAFVLAHEAAHVFLNHAWLSATHRTRRRAAAHLSDVFLFGNSRSYGFFAGNVEAYGRQQELDADAYAARILAQAGYDLFAAKEFFSVLKRYPMVYEAEDVQRTHPGITQRRQRLGELAVSLQPLNLHSVASDANAPLLQSAEAQDGYNSNRIRLLQRSVRDKIAEHDLPGALVQLDELERLDGESAATDCMRGNLYTAIAADVDEAAKALREIVATPASTEQSGSLRKRGTVFFLDQARAIFSDRLIANPDSFCADKGLQQVTDMLADAAASPPGLSSESVIQPVSGFRTVTPLKDQIAGKPSD